MIIQRRNSFSIGLTDSWDLQTPMEMLLLAQKWPKRLVIVAFSLINDDEIGTQNEICVKPWETNICTLFKIGVEPGKHKLGSKEVNIPSLYVIPTI